jgi:hypothetical protein
MLRKLTLAWVNITYHLLSKRRSYVLPYCPYKRLPIGVTISPDIFQRIMYDLLGDIPNIQAYLVDIIITSNGTFEQHAAFMETLLERLQKANVRANLKMVILVNPKLTI